MVFARVLTGQTNQVGNSFQAAAASDPVIAVAGDIACDPASSASIMGWVIPTHAAKKIHPTCW